jgi:DNA-binding Lrp family transcriptional regulator
MKEEGIIRAQVTLLDRKKIGLNTQIFAEVKLNAHGRSNFTEFTEAIRGFPEVLECYVLMGAWIFCCGSSRRTSRRMSASSSRSCRWCRGFRR